MTPTVALDSLTQDVAVPPRSRTFDAATVEQVQKLLNGQAEGQEAPSKNIGYGEFETAGQARSAGQTLNRLLAERGEYKRSISTFPRNGKHVGVIWNKPAKARAEAKATPAAKGGKSSR